MSFPMFVWFLTNTHFRPSCSRCFAARQPPSPNTLAPGGNGKLPSAPVLCLCCSQQSLKGVTGACRDNRRKSTPGPGRHGKAPHRLPAETHGPVPESHVPVTFTPFPSSRCPPPSRSDRKLEVFPTDVWVSVEESAELSEHAGRCAGGVGRCCCWRGTVAGFRQLKERGIIVYYEKASGQRAWREEHE